MEVLKVRRRSVKGKVTRIQNFLDNLARTSSRQALSVRLAGLEEAWAEFQTIHNEILAFNIKDETDVQEEQYADMETRYYDIKTVLNEILASEETRSDSAPALRATATTDVKLPRIALPVFSGNYLEWPSFRDLFKSLIHDNPKLTPSQKLHYLKTSLSGEASGLLQSIDITDVNYSEAWNLLTDRYANERLLIQGHLQSLFGQSILSSESPSGLRRLLDTTLKHVRALNALGINTDHWDHILVFVVTERLDNDSRRQWELSSTSKLYPKFEEVKTFLEQRCRALEASYIKPKVKPLLQSPNVKTKSRALSYATQSGPTVTCSVCSREHEVYRCPEFAKLSDREKTSTARQRNLCFNCLRRGHSSRQCNSQSNCRKCGSRHHTLLHFRNTPSQKDNCEANPTDTHVDSVTAHISNSTTVTEVLLSTAVVRVKDSSGGLQDCRALLDSGSQASFVTEACIQRLGLQRTKANISVFGIGKSGSGSTRGMVNLKLVSSISDFSLEFNALVLNKLSGLIPSATIDTKHFAHIANLKLADPNFQRPGEVDILLGADVYGELLTEGRIAGNEGTPFALNTQLGWVLSGRVKRGTPGNILVHLGSTELQEDLQKFWELEEVAPTKYLTRTEQECEKQFASYYTRDASGRFSVQLPFKEDMVLGTSKDMAIKRFLNIEKRLDRSPKLKLEYSAFMEEYMELGHMEVIPVNEQQELPGKTNYLPHHFVTKESSTTTKLRVVFDASAKTSNGLSLNDTLLIGPKLQDDMWAILLRFRLYKYAFTADIAKMYRQILVSTNDANLQRIVWRASSSDSLEEFRLKTVTYGTASAPYQATKVLQQLAHDDGDRYPLAKGAVLRDFYMDDIMSGVNNLDDGIKLVTGLLELLERGGFQLRKWSSNSSTLLEVLPADLRETTLPLCIEADDSIKALGLHWNPAGDYFFFLVTLSEEIGQVSKRRVLSEVAKLFDPLGWLSPVVILAKIIIQKIWISGTSWDEHLPPLLEKEWITLRGQLVELESLRVQRCVVLDNNSYQLHGFCDASESAYGAVVYLRCCNSEGTVTVHLLCSKTRVSPIKQVSLPRLELCGAVLLARLLKNVQQSLQIEVESCHAWTDSTVTLAWLTGHPSRWKTFVANRVAEIQELLAPENWKHVPSSDNPADAASRGLLPADILFNKLWWHGPSWLIHNSSMWPKIQQTSIDADTCELERKAVKVLVTLATVTWDLIPRLSSLTKLKRVTAYCLRFIDNSRKHKHERQFGTLTTQELETALLMCNKSVQMQEFAHSIANINRGIAAEPNLQSLSPFLDQDGVLRVGGRLRHAKLSYDKRFPILLPRKNVFTELVIRDAHVTQLHAGPQATWASVQRKFWIINGRSEIRKALHHCVRCFRDRASTCQQQMGDLPPHRLEPVRPFLRCGVDYGGPVAIKSVKGRGGKVSKAYIALFVCFTTKAIHLELVSDLSTESFLATLKRFVARRGKCSDIYSDNGSNFVGAKSELSELRRLLASELHNTSVAN